MFQSRRALFCKANSFLRSNAYASRLSSIPNKNHGSTTPEDLAKLYKTPVAVEESQADRKAASGFDGSTYGGSGAVNVGNGGERGREDADTYEEPKAKETVESVARTARVAAAGAVETGLRLGKMAKQVADGVWEVAEKTAENVRDSIAEDVDDGGGRRRARTAEADDMMEEKRSDKFVKDLRRRAGGYDHKDRR